MKYKWLHQRWLKRLLLLIISLAAYYFIIKRLLEFQYWNELLVLSRFGARESLLILLFVLLWSSNIFFEVKKWQVLISAFKKISFSDALKQFFAGSFTAIASPARLAEPGGRMALIDKDQRVHALLMTTLGGLIQNIVIGFCGMIAIYAVGIKLNISIYAHHFIIISLVMLLVGLILIFLMRLFRERTRQIWFQIKNVRSLILINATFLTIARYLVFNLQLIILMVLFSPEVELSLLLQLSPVYFFVITIIPSFFLADVGIRGSAALLVFDRLGINEPVLLTVILGLWLFNVVFPALIGAWILHSKKRLYRKISQIH